MDKLEELNKKESKLKLIFNILSIIVATLGVLVSFIIFLATLTNTIDVPINTFFTTLGMFNIHCLNYRNIMDNICNN